MAKRHIPVLVDVVRQDLDETAFYAQLRKCIVCALKENGILNEIQCTKLLSQLANNNE